MSSTHQHIKAQRCRQGRDTWQHIIKNMYTPSYVKLAWKTIKAYLNDGELIDTRYLLVNYYGESRCVI